ncbi:MAG: tetratricopeptide repeat protein [Chloroflexi bacterium]|nr:tetratricopeptide repeat protein [Chloroflexota bacterium]
MARSPQNRQQQRAQSLNEQGLAHYANWELDEAIDCFRKSIRLAPDTADYHLNLARALARAGDYDLALKSVAEFLRCEPTGALAARFQQFFANSFDPVEAVLTDKMKARGMSLEDTGAALQMWLEFRIARGRESITRTTPEAWAAALDYTVQKVNFRDATVQAVARFYNTSAARVRARHKQLMETLDIMPCDYRYFTGKQNPLDKLIEAATLLEELERRFSQG